MTALTCPPVFRLIQTERFDELLAGVAPETIENRTEGFDRIVLPGKQQSVVETVIEFQFRADTLKRSCHDPEIAPITTMARNTYHVGPLCGPIVYDRMNHVGRTPVDMHDEPALSAFQSLDKLDCLLR